jgi:hypothetical protein
MQASIIKKTRAYFQDFKINDTQGCLVEGGDRLARRLMQLGPRFGVKVAVLFQKLQGEVRCLENGNRSIMLNNGI